LFIFNLYGFSECEQKKIIIYLLKEYNISYSAVSAAVRRFKAELLENKKKAERISLIIKKI